MANLNVFLIIFILGINTLNINAQLPPVLCTCNRVGEWCGQEAYIAGNGALSGLCDPLAAYTCASIGSAPAVNPDTSLHCPHGDCICVGLGEICGSQSEIANGSLTGFCFNNVKYTCDAKGLYAIEGSTILDLC